VLRGPQGNVFCKNVWPPCGLIVGTPSDPRVIGITLRARRYEN
jgi:hypothetical protein